MSPIEPPDPPLGTPEPEQLPSYIRFRVVHREARIQLAGGPPRRDHRLVIGATRAALLQIAEACRGYAETMNPRKLAALEIPGELMSGEEALQILDAKARQTAREEASAAATGERTT